MFQLISYFWRCVKYLLTELSNQIWTLIADQRMRCFETELLPEASRPGVNSKSG